MRDVASGLGLVVVGFVYAFSARGLPLGQGEPGPRLFPFLLAAVLVSLGGSIAVRGWTERPATEPFRLRSWLLIGLTIAYAVAFPRVGFFVSTLAYTTSVVLVLEQRGWRTLAIPAVTTALIYGAFVVGLGVVLP